MTWSLCSGFRWSISPEFAFKLRKQLSNDDFNEMIIYSKKNDYSYFALLLRRSIGKIIDFDIYDYLSLFIYMGVINNSFINFTKKFKSSFIIDNKIIIDEKLIRRYLKEGITSEYVLKEFYDFLLDHINNYFNSKKFQPLEESDINLFLSKSKYILFKNFVNHDERRLKKIKELDIELDDIISQLESSVDSSEDYYNQIDYEINPRRCPRCEEAPCMCSDPDPD